MKMIAKRLEQIRSEFNPDNATQFAIELGLNQPTYARYEDGSRKIPYDLMQKLFDVYNVNLNWLITGEGDMFLPDEKAILEEAKANANKNKDISEVPPQIQTQFDEINTKINKLAENLNIVIE